MASNNVFTIVKRGLRLEKLESGNNLDGRVPMESKEQGKVIRAGPV